MRRLYLQFYLTILASLLMVVLTASALWRFAPTETPSDRAFELAGVLIAGQLAPADADLQAQQQAIDRLNARLRIDLALFARDHRLLAAAGGVVPPPPPRRQTGGWVHGRGGPAWAIRLPDDRWVVARVPSRASTPLWSIVAFLGTIALMVAISAYPIARRLTRRLERLNAKVEALGAGDLTARVKVEGKDEVARLAESFNRSAARIEQLVQAHKMLLANTSHELRTPLSRIRLGIELLKETPDATRGAALQKDIAELDGLIEQILLSSRIEAVPEVASGEDVDLLGVAAEEAVRYEQCLAQGEPAIVRGDRALLQRMVRNLIDNAHWHGRAPIEVEVRREADRAVLLVSDHGPGIAEVDRERIFSPFYRASNRATVPGSGLGLTLVRQIARQHGGDAMWAGTPERPSTMRVELPRKLE
jgi:two-component system, OmpR family, sensor histidine kinase RstB